MSNTLSFPENFIWGAATAAYQIEGAADADGKGKSIWDTFLARPENSLKGESGTTACDHYNRLEEDLGLMEKLGIKHYRFSLSWSRILPDGRPPANTPGIDFYERLVDGLLERGITPWATLYHWDLPQALQDKGGWINRDIIGRFCDYADTVTEKLGDRIGHWMILNEPSVSTLMGHGMGNHAPGLTGRDNYAAAAHHHNMVIGTIYDLLKAKKADWTIGSTFTRMPFRPAGNNVPGDIVAAWDSAWNGNFFDPLMLGTYPENMRALFENHIQDGDMETIKTGLDFVGIQHYSPIYVAEDAKGIFGGTFGGSPDPETPTTGIGWPIEPEGFYEALTSFKDRYGEEQPLVITENGIALYDKRAPDGDVHDDKRIAYYQAYIAQLHRAMADGVNVQGYFAWSLMDNLEWNEGYDMRFGLTFIDYDRNLERIPKDSFHWYTQLVSENRLVPREEYAFYE